MLFLVAFTKPTIILNNTVLSSGEPLQISCSAVKLDNIASFLCLLQMDGVTFASENNSFVHTIESVKSTEAGSYTCQFSLAAVSADIVRVTNQEIL